MIISLIAAMNEDRVIGIDNRLPWKLPVDMKWFREKTMGKTIIMGRKTFESFGGSPLPGRKNIIVTGSDDYSVEGALTVHSVDEALAAAGDAAEVMIIGGASFYEQMLPKAHRFYLTLVHGKFEGDTWFPDFEMDDWEEVERFDCEADNNNRYPCSFIILERRG